jgi:hypothetical protein
VVGVADTTLHMQPSGLARRGASPASGDKRVSNQRSDVCFRDRIRRRPHACLATPTPTEGAPAALVLSPRRRRPDRGLRRPAMAEAHRRPAMVTVTRFCFVAHAAAMPRLLLAELAGQKRNLFDPSLATSDTAQAFVNPEVSPVVLTASSAECLGEARSRSCRCDRRRACCSPPRGRPGAESRPRVSDVAWPPASALPGSLAGRPSSMRVRCRHGNVIRAETLGRNFQRSRGARLIDR